MSSSDVIDDFVHSKNKTFAGDSKKQRIRRALGAYYKKQNESVVSKIVNTAHRATMGSSNRTMDDIAQKHGARWHTKLQRFVHPHPTTGSPTNEPTDNGTNEDVITEALYTVHKDKNGNVIKLRVGDQVHIDKRNKLEHGRIHHIEGNIAHVQHLNYNKIHKQTGAGIDPHWSKNIHSYEIHKITKIPKSGYLQVEEGNCMTNQPINETLKKALTHLNRGWFVKGDPKQIVKTNKAYPTDLQIKMFHSTKSGGKHSPADLQHRVLKNELRKKGITVENNSYRGNEMSLVSLVEQKNAVNFKDELYHRLDEKAVNILEMTKKGVAQSLTETTGKKLHHKNEMNRMDDAHEHEFIVGIRKKLGDPKNTRVETQTAKNGSPQISHIYDVRNKKKVHIASWDHKNAVGSYKLKEEEFDSTKLNIVEEKNGIDKELKRMYNKNGHKIRDIRQFGKHYVVGTIHPEGPFYHVATETINGLHHRITKNNLKDAEDYQKKLMKLDN